MSTTERQGEAGLRGSGRIGPKSAALYRRAWGEEPAAVIVAPGRVNLMGDHIDYAHGPVLPMAIGRGVAVAIGGGSRPAPREHGSDAVVGLSASERGFVRVTASSDPAEMSGWGRYVAAAVSQLGMPASGARISVSSTLPSSGGLSSSSALTMAVVAALAHLQRDRTRVTIEDPETLIGPTVAAERMLGVAGGAMDQIVIAGAKAGSALLIRFSPASQTAVAVGKGLAFVVAASGDIAAKAGAARSAYNRLAVGSRLAAALVASELGWAGRPEQAELPTLGDNVWSDEVAAAATGLPESVSVAEASARSGVDPTHLIGTARGLGSGEPLAVRAIARHFMSESARVEDAAAAMIEASLESPAGPRLGAIFAASHESMRTLGVVTPGLDAVIAAMCDAGAWGARVTGAGFGGYAVATCPPDRTGDVVAAAVNATGGPAFEVEPSEGIRYA